MPTSLEAPSEVYDSIAHALVMAGMAHRIADMATSILTASP